MYVIIWLLLNVSVIIRNATVETKNAIMLLCMYLAIHIEMTSLVITRRSENDSTIGRPRLENANNSWV